MGGTLDLVHTFMNDHGSVKTAFGSMALCLSSGQSLSGLPAKHVIVRPHSPDIRQAIRV